MTFGTREQHIAYIEDLESRYILLQLDRSQFIAALCRNGFTREQAIERAEALSEDRNNS
jgi:hypothetical protein